MIELSCSYRVREPQRVLVEELREVDPIEVVLDLLAVSVSTSQDSCFASDRVCCRTGTYPSGF